MNSQDGQTVEEETGVYHYAACRDCPLYKWVESAEDALAAARHHHHDHGHSAYSGKVPKNAVERRESQSGEYSDE